MTEPEEPLVSRRTIWSRFFRGRRPWPLVGPWISSLIFAGIVFYVDQTIPALHDVITIIYWMLLAIVVFTTARWIRARSSDRRSTPDRRRKDRRHDSED